MLNLIGNGTKNSDSENVIFFQPLSSIPKTTILRYIAKYIGFTKVFRPLFSSKKLHVFNAPLHDKIFLIRFLV